MIPLKYILFGVSIVTAVGYAFYKHYQERTHFFHSEEYTYHPTYDDAYPRRERAKKRERFYGERNCVVCLEEINKTSRILSCGHMFHIPCIDSWLKINSQCPICRKYIDI
ncbi:uncharacterized protein LOC143192540 [Rhynchophorus ferrugineus]|uniref:uncharacterized protein LOC143192540 n=1 Tax=Rhynchophorus ferrugineus TaxID=354439 RepID=UPI003FCC4E6B